MDISLPPSFFKPQPTVALRVALFCLLLSTEIFGFEILATIFVSKKRIPFKAILLVFTRKYYKSWTTSSVASLFPPASTRALSEICYVLIWNIYVSWKSKYFVSDYQRRGGIGKSVEKNRQGFNERQADAVGQRSSCLVPLPPHLQTRGWGLPWCLQCRDWQMLGIYDENFGIILVQGSNLHLLYKMQVLPGHLVLLWL